VVEAEVIAERRLLLRVGQWKQDVVIRIGKPYWVSPDVEAACPVEVTGIAEELADIRGVDPLQALELAQGLVNRLLKSAAARGAKLTWPDGSPYFGKPPSKSRRSSVSKRSESSRRQRRSTS
jgi:uncharacterized protein DUF6968